VEIPTSDPGVVDTGFGGGGLGGGTGGGSGPGGSAGAGPTEPEENPNDGGDPEPVGPMEQCPVAGGAPGTPPGGICAGATVTRIIGNIGDEGNAIRETGGTELYSLPFTPPEPLGGDDYNGKFVVYEWECPDGSNQRSDPCEEPEQESGPPQSVVIYDNQVPEGEDMNQVSWSGNFWYLEEPAPGQGCTKKVFYSLTGGSTGAAGPPPAEYSFELSGGPTGSPSCQSVNQRIFTGNPAPAGVFPISGVAGFDGTVTVT